MKYKITYQCLICIYFVFCSFTEFMYQLTAFWWIGFSVCKIITSSKNSFFLFFSFFPFSSFLLSFFPWKTLYFSWLITLGQTSSTTLNRSTESSLVPYLRGQTFKFSHLHMSFLMVFSCVTLAVLRYISSLPYLLIIFIMKGYLMLSNASSASTAMIIYFCLCSVNVVYHIYRFDNVEWYFLPGINST